VRLHAFEKELSRLGLSTFTIQDAARVTGKKPAYVKLFLARAVAKNRLVRLERGKYALQDLTPFELADGFGIGYVSFLSALSFHGLTTQVPRTVQLACRTYHPEVIVGEARFVFVKLASNRFFGFKRYGNATVAEPEKAVLDGLYLPQRLAASEVARVVAELDSSRLLDYAERFGSSIVCRRLGFLMEHAGLDASRLEKYVDGGFGVLNPALPRSGHKNAKWRILENEVLE